MLTINDTQRFVIDYLTGTGVALRFLTLTIKNRDRVTQEVLGPIDLTSGTPAWLSASVDGSGTLYTVSYSADDSVYTYPPDFVILEYTVQTLAQSVNLPVVQKSVPIAGPSLPTAPLGREPYVGLTEAGAFFSSRLDGARWEQYDAVMRTRALISASDDIDTETFKGRKRADDVGDLIADTTEVWGQRQFPRYFAEFSYTGSFYQDPQQIPHRVKSAVCVQALYLLETLAQGDDPHRRRNQMRQGVTGFSAGRTSENWNPAVAATNRICAEAIDLLTPYLATSVPEGFG